MVVTAICELQTFMNVYSSYNYILMYDPNKEHTTFIMDPGLYFYKVMPFGLKNINFTYQMLVNKMFVVLICNMLVQSLRSESHFRHLEEAFNVL